MDKISFIDGSFEEQTAALKEFFGLSPDQSFEDIEENEYEDKTA